MEHAKHCFLSLLWMHLCVKYKEVPLWVASCLGGIFLFWTVRGPCLLLCIHQLASFLFFFSLLCVQCSPAYAVNRTCFLELLHLEEVHYFATTESIDANASEQLSLFKNAWLFVMLVRGLPFLCKLGVCYFERINFTLKEDGHCCWPTSLTFRTVHRWTFNYWVTLGRLITGILKLFM